ncbi:MAG: MoaD/ThiS family protein [Halieaceae bacterium]|jgi:molybdopterin synthase sulfur carrier subunit|nr:MoaD/ThiS family protein [Halieaceae bacterium]
MLTVLFFARIREELDCPGLELPWGETVADLDLLQARLYTRGGARWQEVLGASNVIRAVNQAVVTGNVGLRDGDEIAFFPPVTGG